MRLRTAHLFSGAGGGLLADLILGHRPVLAVDIDPHCCQVLRERIEDGWLPGLHVHEGDIREFDFSPWRDRVDCISAGFPCQDISWAGPGTGIEGERSGLVREVWRAVDAIRPLFVFLENSPRIRTRGRHVVIAELVARGYSWRDGVLAAADVGAGHKRERWWCLAANLDGLQQLEQGRGVGKERKRIGNDVALSADSSRERWNWWTGSLPQTDRRDEPENDAADALRLRLEIAIQRGGLREAEAETIHAVARYTGAFNWSPPDAGFCGMVHGVSDRMDKGKAIKALGNAQVPLQAAAAWMILMHG